MSNDKKTLIAIRLKKGKARELAQLSIMLLVLLIIFAIIASVQYYFCLDRGIDSVYQCLTTRGFNK